MNPSTLPYGGPKVPVFLDELTERERDVLELVCDGREPDEIAEFLCVPELEPKRAETRIIRKLGARNRTHAAVLAIRAGLIERTP